MFADIKPSILRFLAVMYKESIQIRRNPAILAMSLLIPLMQVILFTYAINTNPKHLSTLVIDQDQSEYSRQLIHAMHNTKYFDMKQYKGRLDDAIEEMRLGNTTFVMHVPYHFSNKLENQDQPQIHFISDSTDPVATSIAKSTMTYLSHHLFNHDVKPSFELISHDHFNPRAISRNYIAPGLLGIILLFSLCMMTAVSLVKEKELGSLEVLLTTPLKPIEVIAGKIAPYVVIGYIQVVIIILMSHFLSVPFRGSYMLLGLCCMPYIIANLSMGMLFSTVAKDELQAVVSSTFFLLPSILLSGFAFPFEGMPIWARWIGYVLPLTHFNNISKGIMLKGFTPIETLPHLIPILIFDVVIIMVASKVFKPTLD